MNIGAPGMPAPSGDAIAVAKGGAKEGGAGRGRDAASSAHGRFSEVLHGVKKGDGRAEEGKAGKAHQAGAGGFARAKNGEGDRDPDGDAAVDAAAEGVIALVASAPKLHRWHMPSSGAGEETALADPAKETTVLDPAGKKPVLKAAVLADAPQTKAAGHADILLSGDKKAMTEPFPAAPVTGDAEIARAAPATAGGDKHQRLATARGDAPARAAPLLAQAGAPAANEASGRASEAATAKLAVTTEMYPPPASGLPSRERERPAAAPVDDGGEREAATKLARTDDERALRRVASVDKHARTEHETPSAARADAHDLKPGSDALPLPPARQVARAVSQLIAASDTRSASAASTLAATSAASQQPMKILTVALQPEALGNVTVRLRSSGTELHVEIAAEQAKTRDLLQRDREVLGKLLEASGLKVDDVQIKATGAEQAFPAQAQAVPQPPQIAPQLQPDARSGSEQQRMQEQRGHQRPGQQGEKDDEVGADPRRASGGLYV